MQPFNAGSFTSARRSALARQFVSSRLVRWPGRWWVALFLGGLAPCLSPEVSAAETPSALPPFTNAVQVLKLSPEAARQGRPASVSGVVTYCDRPSEVLFVQDETAGVFVYYQGPDLKLQPGQAITVKGATAAGLFSPIVWAAELIPGGLVGLPKPRLVTPGMLATGGLDCQWVEMEGVVRLAKEEWGQQIVELAYNEERVQARFKTLAPRTMDELIGARVRLRGVVGTAYNNKRQVVGFFIYGSDGGQITILKPAPTNTFELPARLARSLASYTFADLEVDKQPVRLRGVVTMHWPGKEMYLKDESGGILVESGQTNLLAVGELVDVVGFPARGGYSPVLKDARFRSAGRGPVPLSVVINVDDAAKGGFDGELVTLDGQLLKYDELRDDRATLLLQAGKHVFQAFLRKTSGVSALSQLIIGSQVRVTGVCEVNVNERREKADFQLWLRSPEDVEVVQRPSSWLWSRLLWVVGFLGLAVGIVAIWLVMLRRRVAAQTLAIRRRESALEERYKDLFENAHDIIYAHDLEGRVTAFNRAGELLLGYSKAEFLGGNIRQLVAPGHWPLVQQHIARKLGGVAATSYELEALARNGRRVFLEVRSRLQFEDGKPVGVEGIAHDITERKEAEQALLASEQRVREAFHAREKLGRDLHDGIIQSLFAIGLAMERCRKHSRVNVVETENWLAGMQEDLNAVLRDVRNFIQGLDPDLLKRNDLESALRVLVLGLSRAGEHRFVLNIDPLAARRLNSRQAAHLVHVAREAMTNSLRHSQAKTTVVDLMSVNGHVRFEVRDDGLGFEIDAASRKGQGLQNVMVRAQELDARFAIETKLGSGTAIIIEVPAEHEHD
jgi:PAS domain S-box-containing protein